MDHQFHWEPKNHLESNQFLALALRSFSTSYPNSRLCLNTAERLDEQICSNVPQKPWHFCRQEAKGGDCVWGSLYIYICIIIHNIYIYIY